MLNIETNNVKMLKVVFLKPCNAKILDKNLNELTKHLFSYLCEIKKNAIISINVTFIQNMHESLIKR